jgi:hypothetical protein
MAETEETTLLQEQLDALYEQLKKVRRFKRQSVPKNR